VDEEGTQEMSKSESLTTKHLVEECDQPKRSIDSVVEGLV